MVVTIANSDVTKKRSEVDRRAFERAATVVVDDAKASSRTARPSFWSRSPQATRRSASRRSGRAAWVVYFQSNSGLAIQFVAPGAVLYRKLKAEGTARENPSAWVGTDLSVLSPGLLSVAPAGRPQA